jgi:DNA-binding MarR family transcriptional regulator
MKTKRGLSDAARRAKAYLEKNPGKLSGKELAKKFGLDPATVYRSQWWKDASKEAPVSTDQQ